MSDLHVMFGTGAIGATLVGELVAAGLRAVNRSGRARTRAGGAMAVMRWVALLRGVNVGGGNRFAMSELRALIEWLGGERVVTYMQSGNVVFDLTVDDPDLLGPTISHLIAARHGLRVPVVVRSADDLVRIADRHPDVGRGIEPKFLHVCFLDRAPDSTAVRTLDAEPFAPDGFSVDGREVYVRYPNGSARSKLTIDVFERAFAVTATARNLNTVRKLAELTTVD